MCGTGIGVVVRELHFIGSCLLYSLLNELTGFTEAVLMTCPTTINKVKVSIAIPVNGIVHHGTEIR